MLFLYGGQFQITPGIFLGFLQDNAILAYAHLLSCIWVFSCFLFFIILHLYTSLFCDEAPIFTPHFVITWQIKPTSKDKFNIGY